MFYTHSTFKYETLRHSYCRWKAGWMLVLVGHRLLHSCKNHPSNQTIVVITGGLTVYTFSFITNFIWLILLRSHWETRTVNRPVDTKTQTDSQLQSVTSSPSVAENGNWDHTYEHMRDGGAASKCDTWQTVFPNKKQKNQQMSVQNIELLANTQLPCEELMIK